jgi:hypothetical protein
VLFERPHALARLTDELCAFTRAEWSPLARAFLDLVAEQPWLRREPGMIAVP